MKRGLGILALFRPAAWPARAGEVSPERELKAAFPSPNESPPITRLDRGVLAAGGTADFLPIREVIRFIPENNRLRCGINQTAARRAGWRILSRLFKVARYLESGGQ